MRRSYWSGQLEISLVSFGISLYVATEAKAQMSFRQISRSTGERVRHQKVLESVLEGRNAPADANVPVQSQGGRVELPDNVVQGRRSANQERGNIVGAQGIAVEPPPEETAGIVRQEEIVKGYEYSKGKYVIIEPGELEQLRVPARHVIDIDQFIDQSELNLEYIDKPYFVTPQNDIQIKPFAVIRQALMNAGKMALGKVVFSGREHVIAIAPSEPKGMMAYTLRYASEVRSHKKYFQNIKEVEIRKEELQLAESLINLKSAKFDPTKFVDSYEVAVNELVNARRNDLPVPKDEVPAAGRGVVVDLMDALRKSLESAAPKKQAASEKPIPRQGIGLVKGKRATQKRKTA